MASYDTVIANGIVVDGQNLPRRRADVAIKDGRVAKVGRVSRGEADEVIDASDLIVAPGFVDLHTHYDAQLFWDPYCTISGWHGVTSVAIGNCGFGFAPAKPEDREYLMKSLSRVEAIPAVCIEAALPWTWETFPEWMDVLNARPKGLNMLTYVPVNPLLVHVMGLEAAKSRDTTDEELARLCDLLREGMRAGACGWSAQVTAPGGGLDVQRDYDGSPFASDLMSNRTALAFARVLAEFDHTFIQIAMSTPDGVESDRHHLEQLAIESGGIVLHNAIGSFPGRSDLHHDAMDWIRSCRERGIQVSPQMITTGEEFTFTFEEWNMWDEVEEWREATLGSTAERLAKLGDPARRSGLRDNVPTIFVLDNVTILRTFTDKFLPVKGTRLPDACRILGYDHMVDLLLDIVVADELKTLFQVPHTNSDPVVENELATMPYGLWGVSDGGAHTKFITMGSYPTEGIIKFVRERGVVELEEAHWRLSNLHAQTAGFRDRGTLTEGAWADVIVYDFEGLKLLDEEVAYDLPEGEWRRIRKADGYKHVLVNGQTTFVDGEPTGNLPGRLLRHGTG